jgi:ribonuclease BN (tRNA processing enzyme)
MGTVRLRVLGCGDAFGSGGRLNACFLLEGAGEPLLIDCGATSLQALKRERIDPASVGAVALSHLHGDHFGGLVWLILDGRFAERSKPLLVSGPVGTEGRLAAAFEALYPGAFAGERPFELSFFEYAERRPVALGDAAILPFEVIHRSGAPSYGLRIQYGGRVIAYSGDTEWTESLVELARGADLFVCECNFYDQQVQEMLDRAGGLDVETAHDGLVIELP